VGDKSRRAEKKQKLLLALKAFAPWRRSGFEVERLSHEVAVPRARQLLQALTDISGKKTSPGSFGRPANRVARQRRSVRGAATCLEESFRRSMHGIIATINAFMIMDARINIMICAFGLTAASKMYSNVHACTDCWINWIAQCHTRAPYALRKATGNCSAILGKRHFTLPHMHSHRVASAEPAVDSKR
jgi:hypothetical protein